MLTIRAMSDGKGYSSRHLEHSDYYAEEERVVGQWKGRGAEMLGLSGSVRGEDFEALRQGLDPQSGEFLRQRQGADRVDARGETRSYARHLYDFTFSAPKSVSIMAVLGADERLREAHTNAVAAALRELESHAETRVRQHGTNADRTTGNLALAVYEHDTSRELDPQIHTHAVAANLTYDGAEARWKALQAGGIYERRAYLTEVYRNALACQVRRLGYEIEDRRDERGVVVRGANGEERTLTRKQARSFEAFERRAIEVAAGDQLLFTANRRQPGFHATNGEIARVDQIDDSGRICLGDGRVVPKDYTHLAHGYAVTAHRSQGKSVDEVIVSADGMSRELFYVAASRGRDRVTVVTSDADALRDSVGRTGARQSATELARKALLRMDRGIRRGFAAACDLVRHARTQPASGVERVGRQVAERQIHEHGIGR